MAGKTQSRFSHASWFERVFESRKNQLVLINDCAALLLASAARATIAKATPPAAVFHPMAQAPNACQPSANPPKDQTPRLSPPTASEPAAQPPRASKPMAQLPMLNGAIVTPPTAP